MLKEIAQKIVEIQGREVDLKDARRESNESINKEINDLKKEREALVKELLAAVRQS